MLLTVKLYFLFWVFLANFGPHLHGYLGCVGLLARSAYLLVAVVELHYLCFCQPCFIKQTNWSKLLQCLFISCILSKGCLSVDWRIPPRQMFETRESMQIHTTTSIKMSWNILEEFNLKIPHSKSLATPPPLPSFKVTSRQLKVHGNTIQNWFPEYRWIG